MPPPQKGYKVINHRDVQYRWIMQNRRGTNELVIEASAPVNGQVLTAELPRVVSYDMVTAAIDFGNATAGGRMIRGRCSAASGRGRRL
jgi:hypothetical protein